MCSDNWGGLHNPSRHLIPHITDNHHLMASHTELTGIKRSESRRKEEEGGGREGEGKREIERGMVEHIGVRSGLQRYGEREREREMEKKRKRERNSEGGGERREEQQ